MIEKTPFDLSSHVGKNVNFKFKLDEEKTIWISGKFLGTDDGLLFIEDQESKLPKGYKLLDISQLELVK